MPRFIRQAQVSARGSIRIHTTMMPQEASFDLQRIVVRTVVSAPDRRKEVGAWPGTPQIERYVQRDLIAVSLNSVPSSRCDDLATTSCRWTHPLCIFQLH